VSNGHVRDETRPPLGKEVVVLSRFLQISFFLAAAAHGPAASTARDIKAYLAASGGTLIPAGRVEIDGRRMSCGAAPTILDSDLADFGSSARGFIVLNPRLFTGLATSVKLWIFSHECAHQSVGPDEVKADCVAVRRGRREGWLTRTGLTQICEFMSRARGDKSHFTGVQRCGIMKECFSTGK
jgi:hypothetical protein